MAWFRRKKTTRRPNERRLQMPEGVWRKCDGCKEVLYSKAIQDNGMACPRCDFHFPIAVDARIASDREIQDRVAVLEADPAPPLVELRVDQRERRADRIDLIPPGAERLALHRLASPGPLRTPRYTKEGLQAPPDTEFAVSRSEGDDARVIFNAREDSHKRGLAQWLHDVHRAGHRHQGVVNDPIAPRSHPATERLGEQRIRRTEKSGHVTTMTRLM